MVASLPVSRWLPVNIAEISCASPSALGNEGSLSVALSSGLPTARIMLICRNEAVTSQQLGVTKSGRLNDEETIP